MKAIAFYGHSAGKSQAAANVGIVPWSGSPGMRVLTASKPAFLTSYWTVDTDTAANIMITLQNN